VHDKISSGFYLSTYQAGLWALDHADELHLPLLLFHGTEDQLTSYEASKEFAKKAGDLVTFRLFNGAYHEIHNDLCKQELFDLMINWLDSRVGNEEEE
jgi:alpha-beta hydrolase superfamily lysophospholipase